MIFWVLGVAMAPALRFRIRLFLSFFMTMVSSLPPRYDQNISCEITTQRLKYYLSF